MNQLLKLSVLSRMDSKLNINEIKLTPKSSLKELGSSMAKKSLDKVLIKI
ncbi:hypothetical protein [Psychrobacillus sp. FSL K6-1415]